MTLKKGKYTLSAHCKTCYTKIYQANKLKERKEQNAYPNIIATTKGIGNYAISKDWQEIRNMIE
jgi:heterodisulfide reductase subunit B